MSASVMDYEKIEDLTEEIEDCFGNYCSEETVCVNMCRAHIDCQNAMAPKLDKVLEIMGVELKKEKKKCVK